MMYTVSRTDAGATSTSTKSALGTPSTLLFVPFLYSLLRRGEAKPLEDYV